jgi:hypothetical protein
MRVGTKTANFETVITFLLAAVVASPLIFAATAVV